MSQVRVLSMYENEPSGYHVYNTTSRSTDKCRAFSPFFLGPCELYDGYVAQNVENAWQYSKLYPAFADAGEPTDRYLAWATDGWASLKAERYPMGKGAKPICSIWAGEKLGYIEARKRIYVPLYARAVVATPEFTMLRSVVDAGMPVALRDFDGYDHVASDMSLSDVLNNPARSMGHAFVLAMLLTRDEACKECGIESLVDSKPS